MTASVVVASCATPARFPTQRYVPVTHDMQPWGTLELDDKHLKLEGLEGSMKLQYTGRMPDVEGSDFSGATVYRVTNAEKYFKQNIGRPHLCAGPARWVAVGSRSGAPAWSAEIWVALLVADNWTRYSNDGTGYCAGGMYVLASNQGASPSD
jgi:hypothetical protein